MVAYMSKQVIFLMQEDEALEFESLVKRMGATRSGVIRSLVADWVEWRKQAQPIEVVEQEAVRTLKRQGAGA